MKTNAILTQEAIHSAMFSSTEGYVSLIVVSPEFELQRELTTGEQQTIFCYVEDFIAGVPHIVLPVATLSAGAKCNNCGNDTPEYIRTSPRLEAKNVRIAELENRPATPVNVSENADADNCHAFAWEHVKSLVTTDGRTAGNASDFYSFFCRGWDMRRQYNEQRGEEAERKQQAENERLRRILKAFIKEAHSIADERECPFGVRVLDGLRQQIKLMDEMERELAARDASLRVIALKEGTKPEVRDD
ncbi:TPA: hypothetical protein I8Y21_004531 [Klebsiella oxytoca]|uniref:Uncharacterized protein n=1 Tax=Klebsiella oxytoca TaxID=571 RepID=A0AAN5LB90_KLEOX|nr:hypothetical protein [Klebsiella oxytoca]